MKIKAWRTTNQIADPSETEVEFMLSFPGSSQPKERPKENGRQSTGGQLEGSRCPKGVGWHLESA